MLVFGSLQLQHHETIYETATYGSVRPYRESPLLARARRTESFHSYRDFQAFSLSSKSPVEKAAPVNGNSSQTEARKSTAEGSAAEKAVLATALEVRGLTDAGACCSTDVHRLPESSLDLKRRVAEEEGEAKAESKKKTGFEGAGFLGRKKVPHLVSAQVLAEGGAELPGAASPSPTKTAASPRHRKNDSSCQDYGL